jgi:phosphoribosylaminoimidazole-succinocarboxamide synthase
MLDPQTIASQIPHVLKGTDFTNLGEKYEGKVRDCYIKGDRRILITTDRLSAFDRVITPVPFKGQILNDFTKFWFEETKDICPNYVQDYPDPNVIVGTECKPLMVEMVIRGYITGSSNTSAWTLYERGGREMCGNILPEGMQKDDKFETPIITPSTKAAQGEHDENISPEEIVKQGLLTQEEYDTLADYTQKLFARGTEIAAKQGMILVDTKYEFGRTPKGEIVLIDEIHTPDSSRFWIEGTTKGPSKEFLREWLKNQGFTGEGEIPEVPEEIFIETTEKYIEAFERITGQTFAAQPGDVLSRLEKNLTPYFT